MRGAFLPLRISKDHLMNFSNLSIGRRIIFSFALILVVMASMTAVALWRLHLANQMTEYLVNDKLARHHLVFELLAAAQLNGARALAIAKSDSLEVADFFQSQLDGGENMIDDLEKRLRALPGDSDEQALLVDIGKQRQAYQEVRQETFQLKAVGRILEVEQLTDSKMKALFQSYTGTIRKLLIYQKKQADTAALASGRQYQASSALLAGLGALALALGALLAWLITRSIVSPLRQAVDLVIRVARGDLRSFLLPDRSDEIGRLLGALEHMTKALATMVAEVRVGAKTVNTASREIAAGNSDLSARTERQASSLQETASSTEELTSTVRQNGDHARHANQLAVFASDVAAKGGVEVTEVVVTMAAIDQSAQKIADIIGVIDSIAFQTNILALNAAVEAARAGEQGRGFAVVATEVRSLAQRCATAAREVKSLIDDMVGKVEAGGKFVTQAGTTMEEVVASIQRVTSIMGKIAAASREQEAGILQINQAINEVDVVTQRNATLVEQAAAAADSLQDQAGNLAQVVSLFRLDDEQAIAEEPASMLSPTMLPRKITGQAENTPPVFA
jgi:methyl-accepting chemotaxis protein